jgi:hypothetical protein
MIVQNDTTVCQCLQWKADAVTTLALEDVEGCTTCRRFTARRTFAAFHFLCVFDSGLNHKLDGLIIVMVS